MDCFNSVDGTGLFAGVQRYSVLAGRVEICAVQADSLPRFWALLLKRMQWPMPPKAMDARVLGAIAAVDARDVLRALATETASVLMLARMGHDEGKADRRAARVAADADADMESPFDPVTGEIF